MGTRKNKKAKIEEIESFSIKKYMWHIFEIRDKQQQINVRVAYDMFIVNLELKSERYKGAKGLKYKPVRKMWNTLNNKEKQSQYKIFNNFLNKNFSVLYRLYAEGDKETFIELCNR